MNYIWRTHKSCPCGSSSRPIKKKRTSVWQPRVHEVARQLEILFGKFHISVACVLRVVVFDASERQQKSEITTIPMNFELYKIVPTKIQKTRKFQEWSCRIHTTWEAYIWSVTLLHESKLICQINLWSWKSIVNHIPHYILNIYIACHVYVSYTSHYWDDKAVNEFVCCASVWKHYHIYRRDIVYFENAGIFDGHFLTTTMYYVVLGG